MIKRMILLLVCALLLLGMAKRRTVVITWTAPTIYTDGSPLTVHHYNIYTKLNSATNWDPPVPTINNNTTWTTWGAIFEYRLWAVTAVDAAGNESAKSNVLSIIY